jgi:hypothetical protein
MRLTLNRLFHEPLHTIGELFIEGNQNRFCYTLEDIVRPSGVKVRNWTAIPEGDYCIGIRYSPKFKRDCLVIYNQPDGESINLNGTTWKFVMIHGGNDHMDTEGCPLVGYNLLTRQMELRYNGRIQLIQERFIQGSAEKDLFDFVAPKIKLGVDVRLQVKNI